jgi:hypothetical protein
MKNPETDPLRAVEAYLSGLGGPWSLIRSSLKVSLRQCQPNDCELSKDIRDAIRLDRERSYERAIRTFAIHHLSLPLNRASGA